MLPRIECIASISGKMEGIECATCEKERNDMEKVSANKKKRVVKKNKNVLIVFLQILAIVVLAVSICSCGVVTPLQKKESRKLVYAKEGHLFLTDLEKIEDEPVKLSGEYDPDIPFSLRNTAFTPNEEYMCYMLPSETKDIFCHRLYIKNIKSDDEAVLLSAEASNFALLNNGKVIFAENGSLYVSDISNNKEKISDGDIWDVTKDQKYLIWGDDYNTDTNTFNSLYYADTADLNEKKIIFLDECGFCRFSMTPNGELIFFLDNNDSLYVIENFSDVKEIAHDILKNPFMDSKGQIFYCKAVEDGSLYDLVEDDMLDAEPVPYPSKDDYVHYVESYNDTFGIYTRPSFDKSAYDEALQEYNSYQQINIVRNVLKDTSLSEGYYYQFCMYSNGTEVVLEPAAITKIEMPCQFSGVSAYVKDESTAVKLSDLCESLQLNDDYLSSYNEEYITESLIEYVTRKYAIKYYGENGAVALDKELLLPFSTESGEYGYGFLVDMDRERIDLYSFDITGQDAGKCRLFAENVFINDLRDDSIWKDRDNVLRLYDTIQIDHDNIYYFSDVQDEETGYTYTSDVRDKTGNLYKNGTLIEKGVLVDSEYITDDFCYYSVSKDDSHGNFILSRYDGETSEVIAENVYSYHVFSPDSIAMITDWDSDREEGTFSLYNGKEIVQLCNHVQTLS